MTEIQLDSLIEKLNRLQTRKIKIIKEYKKISKEIFSTRNNMNHEQYLRYNAVIAKGYGL